jgi:hypothetical protein
MEGLIGAVQAMIFSRNSFWRAHEQRGSRGFNTAPTAVLPSVRARLNPKKRYGTALN